MPKPARVLNQGESPDYWIGYTVDSGMALAGKRLDDSKGKPCGKGHIAANLKCHSGESSAVARPKPSIGRSSAKADGRVAAMIAGAALIGMPAVAYAAARANYRDGFSKSAEMAKEQAEDILKQDYKPSDYEKQKAEEVDIGLPINEKMVPDVLYGHTVLTREYATQAQGMSTSKLPKAKQITIVANGFDRTGTSDGGANVANAFAGKEFADHHVVPISNDGFSLKGKTGSTEDVFKEQLSKVLKDGRNPVAVRMAATAYAFHLKHPDLPINLVGYSAGGMASNEAAEILKKLNVPVKVANFGTPYWGLTQKVGDSITFTSPSDYVTQKTPVRDAVNVNGVKDHFAYLKNPTVRSKLKDFFDGKPVQGEDKKNQTPEEKAKAARRAKAKDRAARSQRSRSAEQKTDAADDTPQISKFVAALLKPAIRQVYSDVTQVANVQLKGSGVTGIFANSKGEAFQFDLSSAGRLTYKAATRKDSQDICKIGMQCGTACVPQGDQCNLGLSGGGQAIAQMAIKTLKTEELPQREEIARAMGMLTKEFLQHPIKTIKEGTQREIKVREAIKVQTGVIIPSQTEILKKATQKMGTFVKNLVKKNAEEGAVNASGLAGSIAGGAVAGPIGALAGDLAGALATRKAITDYKALQRAKFKLADDEAFKSAGSLSKLKQLGAATLAELKSPEMRKEIEDNVTGDVGGWAIGNTAATVLTAMGSRVPLHGAAVAMATTPTVVKIHRRIREGENARKAIKEAASEIISAPAVAISKGEDREKAARLAASRKIRSFKKEAALAVAAGTVRELTRSKNA